ncbi:MAG: hypothetical protein ACRERU_00930 [Methylococcales bacterium]
MLNVLPEVLFLTLMLVALLGSKGIQSSALAQVPEDHLFFLSAVPDKSLECFPFVLFHDAAVPTGQPIPQSSKTCTETLLPFFACNCLTLLKSLVQDAAFAALAGDEVLPSFFKQDSAFLLLRLQCIAEPVHDREHFRSDLFFDVFDTRQSFLIAQPGADLPCLDPSPFCDSVNLALKIDGDKPATIATSNFKSALVQRIDKGRF